MKIENCFVSSLDKSLFGWTQLRCHVEVTLLRFLLGLIKWMYLTFTRNLMVWSLLIKSYLRDLLEFLKLNTFLLELRISGQELNLYISQLRLEREEVNSIQ